MSPLQVLPQPDHQGSGQPLLAVGGGEPQQHGLSGQTEQRRDVVLVGLPGNERVVEDHPVLDSGEPGHVAPCDISDCQVELRLRNSQDDLENVSTAMESCRKERSFSITILHVPLQSGGSSQKLNTARRQIHSAAERQGRAEGLGSKLPEDVPVGAGNNRRSPKLPLEIETKPSCVVEIIKVTADFTFTKLSFNLFTLLAEDL